MMVQSGKPSTETTADIESYCTGLVLGLRLMCHQSRSQMRALPDSERRGSSGQSIREFLKHTRKTFRFLQYDWMEDKRDAHLDGRLEEMLNSYRALCQKYLVLRTPTSAGADQITSEDTNSLLRREHMGIDWHEREVEDD